MARMSPASAIDPESAWQQLLRRDPAGQFFYAVLTTGVFCRPDCKTRRPLRANVRFFPGTLEASAAGFRPCLRCKPTTPRTNAIEKIRAHIEAHVDRPVRLLKS